MIRPMIVMTTSISTSVNPDSASPRPERPRSERRVTTIFMALIPNVIAPSD